MPIIWKEAKNSVKEIRGWESIEFKIDPNSEHQTPLPGNHQNYSYISRKGCEEYIDDFQNFNVRPDDIWIVGIPKTGTTWMHNIVYKLKNGIECESIADKLENQFFEKPIAIEGGIVERLQNFANVPSPRIFKTHLPAFLLPKQLWTVKPRIIYTARNPKDTLLSEYHMMRNSIWPLKGTIDEYARLYMNDFCYGMPYFDHIRGFLQLRHLDHVLFTVYEDLVANQFEGIKRVCEFLKCPHSEEQLHELTENVSFKKMKNEFPSFLSPEDKNKMPDPSYKFCRKGKSGSFREEMNEDLIKKFDEWTAEHLNGTDFRFLE